MAQSRNTCTRSRKPRTRTRSRTGSRGSSPPLTLIDAQPAAGMPPGLELLGYVRMIHEEGRSPNDPEVLKLVSPRPASSVSSR